MTAMEKVIALLASLTLIGLSFVAWEHTAHAATIGWDRPISGQINPLFILDTVNANKYVATSTTAASTFPYASTTALTGTSLFTTNFKISTLSGILKAVSGIVSTASNGTDYSLITANTCSAGQFFNAATAAGVFSCGTPSGGGGSGNVATSSAETKGQLPYWTSTSATPATLGGVATTSVSSGTGISFTGTAGALVGGSSLTITNSGVTSLAGTANQITASGSTGSVTLSLAGPHNFTTLTGLALGNGTAAITAYAGTSCTNQFVRSLNASGAATCATVSSGDVSLANLTATDATLTFSGTYTGATARTIGLNLANANTWTATATTTFSGSLLIATTSSNALQINDSFGTNVLNVFTASTTGSIFTVAATTSPSLGAPIKLFDVDQYGHLLASSTRATPTISCTPSGGTMDADSNDVTGSFTTGTLSTACTITFASAYAKVPKVFVQTGSTASGVIGVTSVSATAFTASIGTAVTGDDVDYFVIQP